MTRPAPADTCAIAVIAKAPRPGHVKTRLQALLTPDEAAALGAAFLQDTLANLASAADQVPIHAFVAYAPAGEEARFDGMLPPDARLVLADGSGGQAPGVDGFGRVLLDTTRTLLARGYGAVCVLGADSPTLPTAELVAAASTLLARQADAVLGPADDGGYYLLGLAAPHPEPYARISWSTEAVAAETRARLAEAGLRTRELATWYDVDDPAALHRLTRDLDGHADGTPLRRPPHRRPGRRPRHPRPPPLRRPMTAAPGPSPRVPDATTTIALAILGVALLAVVNAGRLAQPPGSFGSLSLADAHRYVAFALAGGAFYLAAVHLVRRHAVPRWALPAILLVGLAARLLVLVAPPVLSTDIYRYVWDGRVQAAGINPYRFIPADPALAPLRDPPHAGEDEPRATDIYPNINRVDSAPTIYPPPPRPSSPSSASPPPPSTPSSPSCSPSTWSPPPSPWPCSAPPACRKPWSWSGPGTPW